MKVLANVVVFNAVLRSLAADLNSSKMPIHFSKSRSFISGGGRGVSLKGITSNMDGRETTQRTGQSMRKPTRPSTFNSSLRASASD